MVVLTIWSLIGACRLAISAFILAPLAYFLERKTRPKMTYRLLIDHFISGLTGMESVRDLKSQTGMLKVMGTLICVSGALLLTFYKGPQISHFHPHPDALQNNNHQTKTNNWLLGCLYAVIATSFFSMWMLFQGTLNIKYLCKYTGICLMSVFGPFQCALLSLYKRRDVNDWVIDDGFVIFVIIYVGIVGQAMSTVATTWSIKKLGAVFASTFSPMMLISATLFDFLILHTPLYLGSIIGSVVVVTGLYVYLWGKNKEMKAAATMCPPIQNEDKDNTNDYSTNNNDSRLSV
ncbi:WAT1-related protein [Raphanus sativus]|nr:WAT1-related protein [Raphanus sativus]